MQESIRQVPLRVDAQKKYSHMLWVGLTFLLAGLLLLSALLIKEAVTVALAVVFCAIVILPFAGAIGHRDRDLLEIIYPVSFLYLLYFGMRALYVVWNFETIRLAPRAGPTFVQEMSYGLLVAIVGIIAMFVGYAAGIGRNLAYMLPELPVRAVPKASRTMLVYALGLATTLVLAGVGATFWTGAISIPLTIRNLVSTAAEFRVIGFVAISIMYYRDRYRIASSAGIIRAAFFVALSIELFLGFISGSKQQLVEVIVILLVCRYYVERKVSGKEIAFGLVFVVFFVFPFVSHFRSIYNTASGEDSLSVLYASQLTKMALYDLVHVVAENPLEYVRQSFDLFMHRFIGVDALTIIVRDVPSRYPYEWGKTIVPLFFAGLPRLLFPFKPTLAIGRHFAIQFWGQPEFIQSDISITQMGDLYWNFGLPGILLGMFVVGALYRLGYEYFARINRNSAIVSTMLYAFFLLDMLAIEQNIGLVLSRAFQRVLLLLLVTWFLCRESMLGSRRHYPR